MKENDDMKFVNTDLVKKKRLLPRKIIALIVMIVFLLGGVLGNFGYSYLDSMDGYNTPLTILKKDFTEQKLRDKYQDIVEFSNILVKLNNDANADIDVRAYEIFKEQYDSSNTNIRFDVLVNDKIIFKNYGEKQPEFTLIEPNLNSDIKGQVFEIRMSMADPLEVKDWVYYEYQFLNGMYSNRNFLIPNVIICAIVSFVAFIYLFKNIRIKYTNEQPKLLFVDKFPYKLLLLIIIPIIGALQDSANGFAENLISLFVSFLLVLFMFSTTSVRIKHKVFWRYTCIYYLRRFIGKHWSNIKEAFFGDFSKQSTLSVWFMGLAVVLFIEFIGLASGSLSSLVLVFIVRSIAMIFILSRLYSYFKALYIGGEAISSGNLDYHIDEENLVGAFKEHAHHLNSMNEAVSASVSEAMNSERMRNELITNVTHDIKTPLTSIINYVDLLKREDLDNDKADEYIAVIDKQSLRLKKMVDDLVEISKVSSNTMNVNLVDTELKVFMSQIEGEYEEKLSRRALSVNITTPEEAVVVKADGPLLWRVMDNLMGNAAKYSLENSRIYVDLTKDDDFAYITVKNVSKEALNIEVSQLMERFVRGDSSRNTEGSGLGLSIAGGILEAMDGSLDISIDGDLFKTCVKLPLKEVEEKSLD